MAFRRARRRLRLVATHKSPAHKAARRQRFDGEQPAAAASCCDAARGVLRLPFQRIALAFRDRPTPPDVQKEFEDIKSDVK